jgi:hypothetical protein
MTTNKYMRNITICLIAFCTYSCYDDVLNVEIYGKYLIGKNPCSKCKVCITNYFYDGLRTDDYMPSEIKVVITDSLGNYHIKLKRSAFVYVESSDSLHVNEKYINFRKNRIDIIVNPAVLSMHPKPKTKSLFEVLNFKPLLYK